MDSKFYVSLEAARLLKEKGCSQFSPTKAEAIDWLDSKGIGISIIFCEIEMYEYVVESKYGYYSVVESGYKETRLEAEEAAIIKACEML